MNISESSNIQTVYLRIYQLPVNILESSNLSAREKVALERSPHTLLFTPRLPHMLLFLTRLSREANGNQKEGLILQEKNRQGSAMSALHAPSHFCSASRRTSQSLKCSAVKELAICGLIGFQSYSLWICGSSASVDMLSQVPAVFQPAVKKLASQ